MEKTGQLKQRINKVKNAVAAAAVLSGRRAEDIRVICVTKQAKIDDIAEAVRSGFYEIGENRIQEIEKKRMLLESMLPADDFSRLYWHMIGHLQTNKVQKAVRMVHMVQSVENVRLAQMLDAHAAKLGKSIDILVQVNISREETKFGITAESAPAFINEIISLRHIVIKGLMGIGSYVEDAERTRPGFRRLKSLYEQINQTLKSRDVPVMTVLSMGMSNDFTVAIEEGSNMVRIGRAIFGG
ncbi:MAG: YggS family pyridoxal phosphate-dependent enzyme [Candidatus Omnitrophica bacterium]|nr:YggS family pyridoxal phosphate-dependent enzyme [Candidatus Omnitrophota bacterium]MBU4478108.1 YggS family pyridoxal phosphate-dependent enzyme [Candidatus Omnitrophota bacterium]